MADIELLTLGRMNWPQSVISATLTAPPGSPVAGDPYIVAAAPTGAWAGQATKLARWSGSAWEFQNPFAGRQVYNEATGIVLRWNGSAWIDPGYISASLYDANTVLAATVDDTPAPITMAPSTILTRLASGNIKAGTVAELQTLLAIAPAATGSAPLYLQPASPHVDDVEFTSNPTGFDCRVATGNTPGSVAAMTLGTAAPNPYARLSQGVGNVVFNTQRASWMHLQSWPTNTANNPNPALYCKLLTTPGTNMFIWSRLSVLEPFAGYDGAQAFRICFASDLAGHPDATLWVGVGLGNYAGTRTYQGVYCPSGGTSGAYTLIPNNAGPSLANGAVPYEYVAIHKLGTVYHFWLFNDGLQRAHLGSITLGTFVPTWFGFSWNVDNLSTTQPGTPVNCADFLRRLDVATFPF